MEKKNEFKAAAYEQIKKLGGNNTETVKTIATKKGDVDIKVRMEPDFQDIAKQGGAIMERPYVYRAAVEGMPLPMEITQKINGKLYETAAEAFETSKKIMEKYVESLVSIEAL